MNRRAFLRQHATACSAPDAARRGKNRDEVLNPFANTTLPAATRPTGSLTAYGGPWNTDAAAHLLRRTLFGPTRAEIAAAAAGSLATTLDTLFAAAPAPNPPLNVAATDTTVPIGQTWVTQTFDQTLEGVRRTSLRAWWMGQLLGQGTSLTEKMMLFWHNHFVVEFGDINDARYGYQYAALLRQYALGNVRQLAKDITINPAMLRYLNGNQSTSAAPNENYGRELLELFTVGKGPLIAPGNYTNYTEDDVKAAARVLTGWRDNNQTISGYFTASRHDTGSKQFSAAFGNRVLAAHGDQEYQDLLNLIFDQPETARFLCRKLYRWFVYYVIDDATEQNVIRPLADQLRQGNYELAPVLRTLLGSEHFFDLNNRGCVIKSPLDFVTTVCRQQEVSFPAASSPVALYGLWDYLNSAANLQQQYLGDPPNVAGWAAYYQTPQYYEVWINAVTLPRRNQLTDLLISQAGYTRNGAKLQIDPVALVQALPAATASDPNQVISAFTQLLLPLTLTDAQTAFLREALLPGLPDFEWTVQWQQYVATPTTTLKTAVATKLRAMLRALMGLAEYHLS